jgi:hypothetical protein
MSKEVSLHTSRSDQSPGGLTAVVRTLHAHGTESTICGAAHRTRAAAAEPSCSRSLPVPFRAQCNSNVMDGFISPAVDNYVAGLSPIPHSILPLRPLRDRSGLREIHFGDTRCAIAPVLQCDRTSATVRTVGQQCPTDRLTDC